MGQSASTPTTRGRQDNASTRTLHSASLHSQRPVSFFRRISNRLSSQNTRRFGRNRSQQNNNDNNNNMSIAQSTTSSVRRATQEATRQAAAVTGPPPIQNFLLGNMESTQNQILLNDISSLFRDNHSIHSIDTNGGNSFPPYIQIPLRMQEINNNNNIETSSTSTATRRMHILVIEYRPNSTHNITNITNNNNNHHHHHNNNTHHNNNNHHNHPILHSRLDDAPLTPPPTFRFLGLRRPRSELSTTSSTETIQSMPLSMHSNQTHPRTFHHPASTTDSGQWIVYVMNNGHQIPMDDNPSYEDLLWISNMLGQVRPNTTTQAEVEEAIPTTIWTKKNDEKCLVCLDEFIQKQQVRILKCQHVFHRECVDRWLCESHNSCPICRGVPV